MLETIWTNLEKFDRANCGEKVLATFDRPLCRRGAITRQISMSQQNIGPSNSGKKMTSCVEYCTYIHAVKFWAVTVCLKDKINVF